MTRPELAPSTPAELLNHFRYGPLPIGPLVKKTSELSPDLATQQTINHINTDILPIEGIVGLYLHPYQNQLPLRLAYLAEPYIIAALLANYLDLETAMTPVGGSWYQSVFLRSILESIHHPQRTEVPPLYRPKDIDKIIASIPPDQQQSIASKLRHDNQEVIQRAIKYAHTPHHGVALAVAGTRIKPDTFPNQLPAGTTSLLQTGCPVIAIVATLMPNHRLNWTVSVSPVIRFSASHTASDMADILKPVFDQLQAQAHTH